MPKLWYIETPLCDRLKKRKEKRSLVFGEKYIYMETGTENISKPKWSDL